MALPHARTLEEIRLWIDMHPCRCGEHRFRGELRALPGVPSGQVYRGDCPGCGELREVLFTGPLSQLLTRPIRYGDDTPSQFLDPGEWLWLADMYLANAEDDRAAGARDKMTVSVERAAAALDEVEKFLPARAREIPPELAGTSELSDEIRRIRPDAFARRSIERRQKLVRAGKLPPKKDSVLDIWHPHRSGPNGIMRDTLLNGLQDRMERHNVILGAYAERFLAGLTRRPRDDTVIMDDQVLLELRALFGPHGQFDLLGTLVGGSLYWWRAEVDPTSTALADALRLLGAARDAAPDYPADVRDMIETMIPPAAKTLLARRR